MELWDIYDENRIKTGRTMMRGDPFKEGDYHLVVHICIFNSEGKMLIQQRQPFKKGWSNMWDVTVGGSAVSGDSSRSAAEREVMEEIGLEIDLKGVHPKITITIDNCFNDVYVITQGVDISSLKLQYEEVQAVKWADAEEIKSLIAENKFIPYHTGFIDLLFHFRTRTGTLSHGEGK
ncbi:MAG: NUDIX domain-containing protein [Oscillospiraceae bacterium]|nr:NUDIX domain-containing protein [Oscillospiraceae bacterium]